MARNPKTAPEEKPEDLEDQVESQEQDTPDAATEEHGTEPTPEDARAAALASLAGQNDPPKVDRPEAENPEFNGGTVDAGGDVKLGVLIDTYQVKHAKEDRYVVANKGQVINVTAALADRAVSHDWAVRL